MAKISELPHYVKKTEKAFWKLISEKVEKHMEGCSDGK